MQWLTSPKNMRRHPSPIKEHEKASWHRSRKSEKKDERILSTRPRLNTSTTPRLDSTRLERIIIDQSRIDNLPSSQSRTVSVWPTIRPNIRRHLKGSASQIKVPPDTCISSFSVWSKFLPSPSRWYPWIVSPFTTHCHHEIDCGTLHHLCSCSTHLWVLFE